MRWSLPCLLILACGGASTGPTTPNADARSGATMEDALLLCHDNGGPNRTDYPYVASYTCPDGSQPLFGDAGRAPGARVGNVGAGPDGHIVDLYEIPCRPTPVRLYIDGYHCGEGVETEIDPQRLNDDQLANLATMIRNIEQAPLSARATDLRPDMLAWLEQTEQVRFGICRSVVELVDVADYAFAGLLVQQLYLSAAATIIEQRGQLDEATLHASALAGVLRTYQSLRAERRDAASAAYDSLLRRSADGSLAPELERRLQTCQANAAAASGSGLVMTVDGENVWPPEGPGCDRLVRCCEGQGYVQNGVAVSIEGNSHPMMCQLAAASGSCEMALTGSLAEVCADY